ncbi:hypothetical protein H7171_01235 [Candidatus Saccharibacteria bacterium]|nr:hypothetical protein [Candidatus Saccharibacteria bacterium]
MPEVVQSPDTSLRADASERLISQQTSNLAENTQQSLVPPSPPINQKSQRESYSGDTILSYSHEDGSEIKMTKDEVITLITRLAIGDVGKSNDDTVQAEALSRKGVFKPCPYLLKLAMKGPEALEKAIDLEIRIDAKIATAVAEANKSASQSDEKVAKPDVKDTLSTNEPVKLSTISPKNRLVDTPMANKVREITLIDLVPENTADLASKPAIINHTEIVDHLLKTAVTEAVTANIGDSQHDSFVEKLVSHSPGTESESLEPKATVQALRTTKLPKPVRRVEKLQDLKIAALANSETQFDIIATEQVIEPNFDDEFALPAATIEHQTGSEQPLNVFPTNLENQAGEVVSKLETSTQSTLLSFSETGHQETNEVETSTPVGLIETAQKLSDPVINEVRSLLRDSLDGVVGMQPEAAAIETQQIIDTFIATIQAELPSLIVSYFENQTPDTTEVTEIMTAKFIELMVDLGLPENDLLIKKFLNILREAQATALHEAEQVKQSDVFHETKHGMSAVMSAVNKKMADLSAELARMMVAAA